MKIFFHLITLFLALNSEISIAQESVTEKNAAALKEIRDTAKEICTTIPIKGTGHKWELSGEAKAKVNELISKVADIGVSGTGRVEENTYEGLQPHELAEAIKKSDDCRIKIFERLSEKLLIEPQREQQKSEQTKPQAEQTKPQAEQTKSSFNIQPQKYAAGTFTSPCGCWGIVSFGQVAPQQLCQSGFHMAVPCAWYCPQGGNQWQTVCM